MPAPLPRSRAGRGPARGAPRRAAHSSRRRTAPRPAGRPVSQHWPGASASQLERYFADLLSSAVSSPLERQLGPYLGRELAAERSGEPRQLRASRRFGIPHPSPVIREFSERPDRPGELYAQMLTKDTELAAFADKRTRAVLNLPRRIEPADGSPRSRETADFCHRALRRVPSLAVNLRHQAEATLHGLAIDEVIWERLPRGPLRGALVPVDLLDRPMWRFGFLETEGGGWEMRVRRRGGQVLGPKGWLRPPPGKFLVYRRGTKDGPWGEALLDRVWWTYMLKKEGWKDFAIALQKWGQPTAVGTYPSSGGAGEKADRAQQKRLLALLETIQNDYALALPQGYEVRYLEATRGGSVSYAGFLQLCARAQALLILGEMDTSSVAEGPGSYAKAEISNSVRLETMQLDAHDLCAHLTETLLRWMVELNFGPGWPVPRWCIDVLEAEDRAARQKALRATLDAGLPVARRDWYAAHQVREPEAGEPLVPPPAVPILGSPPSPLGPTLAPRFGREPGHAIRLAAGDELRELEGLADQVEEASRRLAAGGARASLEHYARAREVTLELAAAGELEGPGGLERLARQLDTGRHARALETSLLHGAGLALWRHRQEGAAITELTGHGRPVHLADLPDAADADTPAAALAFWTQVLRLPRALFDQLSDAARFFATTVAGVDDLQLLARIHELLRRAIADGLSISRDSGGGRFVELLDELFRRAGLDPTSRWHAELIHFQNLRNADAVVGYRQIVDSPTGASFAPYLLYLSRGDDRVRPSHRAMHERIFATGHPIWRLWYPPNGFGCRCEVMPINRARARRLGLEGDEPTGPWPLDPETGARAQPDPRFRSAPSFTGLAQGQRQRAEQLLDDARAQSTQSPGAEDLLQALSFLFERTFG